MIVSEIIREDSKIKFELEFYFNDKLDKKTTLIFSKDEFLDLDLCKSKIHNIIPKRVKIRERTKLINKFVHYQNLNKLKLS